MWAASVAAWFVAWLEACSEAACPEGAYLGGGFVRYPAAQELDSAVSSLLEVPSAQKV